MHSSSHPLRLESPVADALLLLQETSVADALLSLQETFVADALLSHRKNLLNEDKTNEKTRLL